MRARVAIGVAGCCLFPPSKGTNRALDPPSPTGFHSLSLPHHPPRAPHKSLVSDQLNRRRSATTSDASRTTTPGKSNRGDGGIDPPKKGDRFRCDTCGMEIQVTADRKCKDRDHVHFHCCGRELIKV
jgi:hypothetical protein